MGRKRTVKKISIVLFVLFAAAGVLLYAAAGEHTRKERIHVRTETEPICNHFPDLPKTSEIQWCSRSSEGIGLTTTTVYIFAFYDRDISHELRELEIESKEEDVELYFTPAGMNTNQKWRFAGNAEFAFQTGVKSTQKMNTTVYVNDAGTILYMEAVGD